MLSQDMENLARALEQIAQQYSGENALLLNLACANLHSLADQVQSLEETPLAHEVALEYA